MLWLGLALWLLSLLASYVLEGIGESPQEQEVLMDMGKTVFQYFPILALLSFCLIVPVLEELGFRLWGVGKRWTAAVSLVLMAGFAMGEIGMWGLLFVVLFILVWVFVKEAVGRNWCNALVTSTCFALCHISGYAGFSAGMVLGLLSIFGMALVMCWLTINVSFWLSCLLHVLNNSVAVVLPLLLLPSPVTTMADGTTTSMEPIRPFTGIVDLQKEVDMIDMPCNSTTEVCLVGEPSEIARMLAVRSDTASRVYYDSRSRHASLEERVVYRVRYDAPQVPDYRALLQSFRESATEYYDGKSLVFDTVETTMKEVWLVYADGREEKLTGRSADLNTVKIRLSRMSLAQRHYMLTYEQDSTSDSSGGSRCYCLELEGAIPKQAAQLMQKDDQKYGFRIEMRGGVKAKRITIK